MAEDRGELTDRALLVAFVEALNDVLTELVERRRELLPEHLGDVMWNAWPPTHQALIELLRQLAEPEEAELLNQRLNAMALTGAPLRYKLAGFDAAHRQERPPDSKGLRWWFRRIFGWANVILGSLAGVLPPAEVVKEFKEASEQGMEDAELPPNPVLNPTPSVDAGPSQDVSPATQRPIKVSPPLKLKLPRFNPERK
jgi:hypothetical protein